MLSHFEVLVDVAISLIFIDQISIRYFFLNESDV